MQTLAYPRPMPAPLKLTSLFARSAVIPAVSADAEALPAHEARPRRGRSVRQVLVWAGEGSAPLVLHEADPPHRDSFGFE